MVFNNDKVEVGDILLYRPLKDSVGNKILGKFITMFSYGGKYAHAAVYSGDGNIIESHLDTGVVEKQLTDKWYSKIDIFRLDTKLNSTQKTILIKYMRTKELGKGYDLAAFPSSFIKGTIAMVFGWKNFSKGRPLMNDDAHRFCSELVAASYWNALRIELVPDLDPNSVQPGNLGKSKVLMRIS